LPAPAWFRPFKTAVYALLAANLALYALFGSANELVDSIAWIVLLAAAVLYSALLLLVPVWAWRGEWLDAWDALLWLAAFFAIELNVLGRQSGYAANS